MLNLIEGVFAIVVVIMIWKSIVLSNEADRQMEKVYIHQMEIMRELNK